MDIETGIIDRLVRALGGRRSPEGAGDDAAVLRVTDGRVVALDTLVEGIHFRREWSSWSDVAFKALAVNFSDLFAMGADPRAILLSVSIPNDVDPDWIEGFAEGLREARDELAAGATLVGGDTTGSPGPFVVSVTVIGDSSGVATRAGAEQGERVWLSGPVGLAGAGVACLQSGLRPGGAAAAIAAHRRPVPRPMLRDCAHLVGATLDVSDGLSTDVWRICRASDVHIELDIDRLPGRDQLDPIGTALGEDPRTWQLGGGDDYVLVATARGCPGAGWLPIGRVVGAGAGLTGIRADGTRDPLPASGFAHF